MSFTQGNPAAVQLACILIKDRLGELCKVPVPQIGSRTVDTRHPGPLRVQHRSVVQVVCKTLFEQGRLTLIELRKLTGVLRNLEHACQAEDLYLT